MVPQGGRYKLMSPELDAVGGLVCTALALSYFLPSVTGPSDPSPPSSYVPDPSSITPHLALIAKRDPNFMEGDGSPFGSEMEAALDPQMYTQLVVDEWVTRQGKAFTEEMEGAVEAIIEDWGVEDGPSNA